MELMLDVSFFFFNDTATTEIYTLSLHDALPIYFLCGIQSSGQNTDMRRPAIIARSEEHTSELQSRLHLVCRLLLGKEKTQSRSALCANSSPPASARRLSRSPS